MKKVIIYLLAVVLLASCHSSKKVQKGTDVNPSEAVTTSPVTTKPNKELSATEKLLLNVDSTNANYTAKVKVKLNANNKNVSTSGSLKMRWNDVIQISLVDPILGITEVGRLEFSENDVLLIDRINKQYVQETYESLSTMAKKDLNYAYIQALFWSEAQKENNDDITYKIPLKKPVTLNLKLKDVGHKSSWDAHTDVSSKYTKVTVEEFVKSLSNL